MAVTQVKRSTHKKQLVASDKQSAKPKTNKQITPGSYALVERKLPCRRFVDFPQVIGKVVKRIHFYTSSDYHCITIDFDDGACLNLEIDPSFIISAELQQIVKGNIHTLSEWPAIRSQT